MSSILYYPVIDCDTDGKYKVAMWPTDNEETVRSHHALWLQEIVPNSFRLCSTEAGLQRLTGEFIIRCPRCGDALRQIVAGTGRHNHGLYVCSSCKR